MYESIISTPGALEVAVTATAADLATALDGTKPPGLSIYRFVANTDSWVAHGIADTVFTASTPVTFTVADQTTGKLTATGHGYSTGDGPVQVTTSSALPTGLTTATDYWIIKVDVDTIQLADSLAHAQAGTFIVLSSNGTGTNKFNTAVFTAATHKLRTGMPVQVSNSGGALPTGLSAATTYWVYVLTPNTFYLYDTLAHAVAGGGTGKKVPTTAGTGTQTATTTATATAGSVFVPSGKVEYLDGAFGAKVSVIRDTADGKASLAPLVRI